MKNIIIVESPSKSKTIESYMGDNYRVLSSKGHVRDLATSGIDGLGIKIKEGFIPIYKVIKEKQKLVSELKEACKNAKVFLATDPDREGEAISFHLAQILNLKIEDLNRVEFNEVTKEAVLEAFAHPRAIDMELVESQETRRMLDRIIGFKLSKLLNSKIKSQAAGRVQSAALKMIVDLEDEITSFIPVEYFEMEAIFKDFKLSLDKVDDSKADINNRELANKIFAGLNKEFIVSDIFHKEAYRESKTAYTTSLLQQDSSNKLNFNSVKTMRIAQSLYEGKTIGEEEIGLISYMRTDSTHLSDSFVKEANLYIKNQFGDKYLGKTKIRAQKLAQNAHEAIRPTSVNRDPDSIKKYLTPDEYKVYKLIYNRAIGSLMAPAKLLNTKVSFKNNNTIWTINGQTLLFDGYLLLHGITEADQSKLIPNFKIDEKYIADEINILDLFTKPKSRYTEATLIKDMEEKGIGRPSTYAQTLTNLTYRKYVEITEKKLYPTPQGILTIRKLDEFFSSIINIEYTANMEETLDKISKGELDGVSELTKFYDSFIPLFDIAKTNMKGIEPTKTGEICPVCGGDLVKRDSKYGPFVACLNYPECTYIKDNGNKEKPVDTNINCPNCGKGHLIRHLATRGTNAGNYFYSCNNFPRCKTVFNSLPTSEKCPRCGSIMLDDGKKLFCSQHCEEISDDNFIVCPVCKKGHLVERIAKKGKNSGNKFYACSNFPKCKTAYTLEPTKNICEKCGAIMLKDGDKLVCSNSKCK